MSKNQSSAGRRTNSIVAAAILFGLCPLASNAQTTDTLMAVLSTDATTRLGLFQDGGFYLNGIFDNGVAAKIPVTGAGTRVMWYPGRGAFRAGGIDGTQWEDANIGVYSTAFGYNTRGIGDYSTALGYNNAAAGLGSLAMGQYCTATGLASVALGYHASTNNRTGSFVYADRSVVDDGDPLTDEDFRSGINNSANWRVAGGFRIFTSATLATGVTMQSGASVSNWGQSNAVISTSTGAMLTTGGIWQNASDSSRKHRIEHISGEQILARLRQVPITEWSYKNEGNVRHLGPMAQDFRTVFGLGSDEKSIGTVDADGVALAGVQALDVRTTTQASELKALKEENEILRKRLDAVETRTGMTSAGMSTNLILLLAGFGFVGLMFSRWKKRAA